MILLILDGTAAGRSDDVGPAVAAEAIQQGHTVERLVLRDLNMAPCRGCFHCWVKTPGLCSTDDDGRLVARRIVESHAVVLVTPVTFGGYSSYVKRALDRSIGNLSPLFRYIHGETHHWKRYSRYPRTLSVGLLPKPDPEAEELFRTIQYRNSLNMYSPAIGTVFFYDGDTEAVRRDRLAQLFAETGVTT